ncbi:MAG: hypothetical protein ACAH95_03785 [Fimbriimonas sp.]
MTKKSIAVLAVLVLFGIALLCLSRGSFVTQVVESNNHRTTEYGLFGTSFPLKSEQVPGLKVDDDVLAHLSAVAPWSPLLDDRHLNMTTRIFRPTNSEWYAKPDLKGDPLKFIDHYKKHLKGARVDSYPGMINVVGKGADGSDVWIWCDNTVGRKFHECGFKVTSRFK